VATNTLTNLIPTIRESLDVVSRELVGFIPAVWRNPEGRNLQRAAKGQTIRFHITPAQAAEDITPGQEPADTGAQTIGSDTMTISKSRAVPIQWTGIEENQLSTGDRPTLASIQRDQFAQAFRTLTNEVENDLGSLYVAASRSYGTAGTQPFATAGNLSDFAGSLRILNENGAPSSDLHMVLSNLSAESLRGKQSVLFKANEAGTDNMLRNGALGRVQSFMVGESNQVDAHTKGTGTLYTTDTAGYAVGATTITLITGSGTILAGDTVTFAGDTNKYLVTTGIAAPGAITIAKPGLKVAIAASATALTVGNSSNGQNMFFARNAIVLVTRLPELPGVGDKADDRMVMQDPFTGLAFEISLYKQYRRVKIEVALNWGYKMAKPEHAGVLLS
jgi:hypothetical protein